MKRLRRPRVPLRLLLSNAVEVGGLAAFTWGAYLIYEPAGFLTGGVLAFAWAAALPRRS